MQLFSSPTTSPFAAMQPADSGSTTGTNSTSSSSSDSGAASITANDFLQLLVTEMQNQDPTADTDPNEYINQLVQVNSLEQLVQINQDLTGSASSTTDSSGNSTDPVAASSDAQGVLGGTVQSSHGTGSTAAKSPAAGGVSGNLSATDTGTAASRVASALGAASQTLAPGSAGSPLNSALGSLRSRAHQVRANQSNPAR